MCFALDDPASFSNVTTWIKDIRRTGSQKTPMIVVGTKGDVEQAIDSAEIDRICKEHDVTYIRTSAKTGANVREFFIEKIAATT